METSRVIVLTWASLCTAQHHEEIANRNREISKHGSGVRAVTIHSSGALPQRVSTVGNTAIAGIPEEIHTSLVHPILQAVIPHRHYADTRAATYPIASGIG
jgi:hypothetical protein